MSIIEMSSVGKRDRSPSEDMTEMSKRYANFDTPPRRGGILVVPQTPSCSTPTAASVTDSSNYRSPASDPICPIPMDTLRTLNTPVQFSNDSQLTEEELLLYSLMTLVFPSNTFISNFASNKYDAISNTIFQITGVKYSTHSIRNYFHRVRNNKMKGFGKTKGILRWKYFQRHVKAFTEENRQLLEQTLNSGLDDTTINVLLQQLRFYCTARRLVFLSEQCDYKFNFNSVNSNFDKDIIQHLTTTWSKYFCSENNMLHFYHFGQCPGYAELEVQVTSAGTWKLYFDGKHEMIGLDWLDLPTQMETNADLVEVLNTIGDLRPCEGCDFERYKPLLQKDKVVDQEPVFMTTDGNPAAVIDIMISKNRETLIRSSKCLLLLVNNSLMKSPTICEPCRNTNNYLRTMLSRHNRKGSNTDQAPSRTGTRFSYLSKEDLLAQARNAKKEMKYWRRKCKDLEKHRNKMETVGPKTNNDLRKVFAELYDGISDTKAHLQDPVCKWDKCTERFENVELLYDHCKQHIERVDIITTAPIEREYKCHWEGCCKHFTKIKLIHNHLREHTRYAKDELMEVLLRDQAKALNTSPKQMRWHPMVIQWSLKMYCKSHSTYEELRSSGALKLPSGRTLSDYKNFNVPRSGWHTDTIKSMKTKLTMMNPPKHAKLGGLFFDEIKIKEGLVFDTSTWELIGFVDSLDGSNGMEQTPEATDKLATHVLQFFYRSLFFKFDFPCAYFLTQGATAVQLNRLFWLGVSLLHGYGFDVLLVCCDGASSNRTFFTMNTTNELHSEGYNPFSRFPIFFMSDPPHLMKKLRNNLFNSGFKWKQKRFTRQMMNDGKYILWEHITDIYKREQLRSLYVTDLRSSHINIDNISKMRVKLAVDTLSEKVANEMSECDDSNTKATQEYISACSTFWHVFNSSEPLHSQGFKDKIKLLDGVLLYFNNWKKGLKVFKTKSEQGYHFVSWQTMFDLTVGHPYLG